MNIYHINKNIVRFNIFNLINDSLNLAGQFRIYYNLKTNKYLINKFGGFGSLTWFPKVASSFVSPSPDQHDYLKPFIMERLETACYYDRNRACSQGRFLLDAMNAREQRGEYLSHNKQYYVWDKDEFAEADVKAIDQQAITMLGLDNTLNV